MTITKSKLVANLLEDVKDRVPIGQTILTSNIDELPDEAIPMNLGDPITNLHVSQFDAFGDSIQTLATKRDDLTNDIDFSSRPNINEGLITEIAFEPNDGVLKFIRRNGSEFQIDGFLTQSDFGLGPAGPKGPKGLNGFDEDDGDDGNLGEIGCAGDIGLDGVPGVIGPDGNDGEIGIQGPPGPPGQTGYQGSDGEMGRFGNEGCRGKQGPDCGNTGPKGTSGESVDTTVVISSTDPGGSALIWGVP